MVKLNASGMKDYASLKQALNIVHIFRSLEHFKSFVVLLQTNLLIRKEVQHDYDLVPMPYKDAI